MSDDPQPTDYRHFEIYTFSNGTVTRDRTGGASGMTTMSGLLTNGFYAEVSGFGRRLMMQPLGGLFLFSSNFLLMKEDHPS